MPRQEMTIDRTMRVFRPHSTGIASRRAVLLGTCFVPGICALLAACTGCGDSAAALPALPGDTPILRGSTKETEIFVDFFSVTIPTNDGTGNYAAPIRLDFELYALVDQKNKRTVEKLLEQRRADFSDRIIRVCRNVGWQDLGDPRMRLIRAKFSRVGDEVLGPRLVRRFVISDLSIAQQ